MLMRDSQEMFPQGCTGSKPHCLQLLGFSKSSFVDTPEADQPQEPLMQPRNATCSAQDPFKDLRNRITGLLGLENIPEIVRLPTALAGCFPAPHSPGVNFLWCFQNGAKAHGHREVMYDPFPPKECLPPGWYSSFLCHPKSKS